MPTPPEETAPPKEEEKPRVSDAQRVIQLVLDDPNTELFITPEGEAFVAEQHSTHIEYHRVATGTFRRQLAGRFYRLHNKPISDSVVKTATETLAGIAEVEGMRHEIRLRVASGPDGAHYLDACDEEWRAIRITADGPPQMTKSPPVRFRRSPAMHKLPTPLEPPDDTRGHLKDFLNLRIGEHDLLVRAWLLQAMRQAPQYPILILKGRPGSAKSTTARILGSLVDPQGGDLQGEPTDIKDLMIAGKHSHVLAFDNLTTITKKVSDALCCVATGAGYRTRALYTDDDQNIIALTRPMILAGIGNAADRPDLIDRALIVELDPIPTDKRREDSELWRRFEDERPYILWRLIEDFRRGLEREGAEPPHLERMAEFHRWAFQCLGNDFHREYASNRKIEGADDALEGAAIVEPLIELLYSLRNTGGFEGSAAELLDALEVQLGEGKRQPTGWPKTPRLLSTQLREISAALEAKGHRIIFERANGKRRVRMFHAPLSHDDQLGLVQQGQV